MTFPPLAASTSTHSSLLYLPVPEVPFPSLKENEIAKIKLSGKVLWKVLCISKDRAQGEKGRRGRKGKDKECFRITKGKFPYILHPGENSITSKLVEKNYRRSNKKPIQNVFFERKNIPLTDMLLHTKFTAWQLHNCFQHSAAPSRARLTPAQPPSQGKTLTDKSMLPPTEQTVSEVIGKLLTACWQLRPTLPFSPRTTFIRQCRVRPFRWRPEQWCSISPRQLRMISGLREKSSISMRR